MARAFLFLNDPVHSLAHARVLLLASSVCVPSCLIASVCPPALSPPPMHAVAAHQLHRASASFISSFLGPFFVLRSWFLVLHPSPFAQCLQVPLCPLHRRGLMARAFLFLDDPIQSLDHAHAGSNPILEGHCPYPIFCPCVYNLYAPYHKRSRAHFPK
jgi:hypothetical protein